MNVYDATVTVKKFCQQKNMTSEDLLVRLVNILLESRQLQGASNAQSNAFTELMTIMSLGQQTGKFDPQGAPPASILDALEIAVGTIYVMDSMNAKVYKEQHPLQFGVTDPKTPHYQVLERKALQDLTLQLIFKEAINTVEKETLIREVGTQEDWRAEIERRNKEKRDQDKDQNI